VGQLDASGQGESIRLRNPQEPFRQLFSALRLRLKEAPGTQPFRDVAELIAELAAAERSLVEVKAVSLAATLVRPVRWEAEIFGFRTVSLDIRQNTTVTNRMLQEIWHKMNPVAKVAVPKDGSPEWTAWIMDELNKPLGFLPNFFGVSEEARELLDLLYLIRETLDGPDPQSIGTFILSNVTIGGSQPTCVAYQLLPAIEVT
jgi:phosphoenolpyruvate carboxylase